MKVNVVFFSLSLLLLSACGGKVDQRDFVQLERGPEIFPDYKGVTIPWNIAPLNFRVEEDSISLVEVIIERSDGEKIEVRSSGSVQFPMEKWENVIKNARGDSLNVTVSIKRQEEWFKYESFSIFVSKDPIDYGLSYRLIAPGYEVYSKMGIYQRELSGFSETPIIENTLVQGSCVNCHSFRETDPEKMSLHIRGQNGGTLLTNEESMKLLDTKTDETMSSCVYPYWHPSGDYIVYSVNKTQQAFHSVDPKQIEVFDHASDVVVFDRNRYKLFSTESLSSEGNFETFPAFSPDGETLYFCSSESRSLPKGFKDIQYNLLSIEFDPQKGDFADKVDTLVNARDQGKSISFPRPSYDGKFLMYTKFNYGNFSIWHPEADIWLLDLDTGQSKPLEKLNSARAESYHSWSSNSRWVVFSSRRVNGLYTMPYLAHVDEEGNTGKPFLLPQKDPNHYDDTFYSFNVPEFINGPVNVDLADFEKLVDEKNIQVSFSHQNP